MELRRLRVDPAFVRVRMSRRGLAAGLRRVVAAADGDSQAVSSALPVRREAVKRSRTDLLELADRVAGAREETRAVSLARDLLTDADSPLYQGSGDLHGAVREALAHNENDPPKRVG